MTRYRKLTGVVMVVLVVVLIGVVMTLLANIEKKLAIPNVLI